MSNRTEFNDATLGFYQGSLDLDGLSLETVIDIGIGSLFKSQYPDLLRQLDDLLASDDETIREAWKASPATYVWDDAPFIRQLLHMMHDNVTERIRSGRGIPG